MENYEEKPAVYLHADLTPHLGREKVEIYRGFPEDRILYRREPSKRNPERWSRLERDESLDNGNTDIWAEKLSCEDIREKLSSKVAVISPSHVDIGVDTTEYSFQGRLTVPDHSWPGDLKEVFQQVRYELDVESSL